MANNLTYEQVYAVLNEVAKQATGAETLKAVDTASFVTVAQTALKAGYDQVNNALSQVLSRTLFAVRLYSAKFKGLMADSIQYGNHVRKINYVDKPAEENKTYSLTDGQSIDQYVIKKPEAIQTNFYGGGLWSDHITRFSTQLKQAFRGPDELGQYIEGFMLEWSNKHEQENESMARACLCNFIAGKVAGDTANVIHLLTEYNALTGLQLTDTTVYQPDNFVAFMRWAYGRIAGICAMLTERSIKFHTNLNISGEDKLFVRHTAYQDQKIYLTAQNRYQTEMQVLADTYHDNYLKLGDNETVNYWQDIDNPTTIEVYESYLKPDGSINVNPVSGAKPTKVEHIFGVIFDREAVGTTIIEQSMNATPFNARGEYSNIWWNCNYRWWNDFTENGVVLLLD